MQTAQMYDNETMKWTGSDGTEYLVHVQQDNFPDNPRSWNDDPITTMACWHSRYGLGDDIGNVDVEEFWRDLVRNNVSELEITEAVEAGKLLGIRLVQNEDGLVDVYETTQLITILGKSEASESLEYAGVFKESVAQCILDDLTVRQCMTLLKPCAVWLPLWLYDHSGITMSCGTRTGQYADEWDSGQVGWIIAMKDKVMKELCVPESEWRDRALKTMKDDVQIYDQYLTGDVYGYTLYEKNGDEWEESDSSWGYYGADIVASGMIEELPDAKKALEQDKCEFGTAHEVKTVSYIFD